MTCYEEILSSETEEDEFDISLRYGFNEGPHHKILAG